ncbi:MAG: hypothetical protein Q8936_14005 [Bacillota bacterium]|nr:hypothetical protein [Bacillota bacterium]
MKKKNVSLLLLVLCILFFSGCTKVQDTNTSKPSSNNIESAAADDRLQGDSSEDKLHSYINAKYTFKTSFPSDWADVLESENGDGAILYDKDGNDVRVFADKVQGNYEQDLKDKTREAGGVYKQFVTNSGEKGVWLLSDSDGKKCLRVVVVKNNIHYDFYALVSKDFYDGNLKKLTNIAKSIVVLS